MALADIGHTAARRGIVADLTSGIEASERVLLEVWRLIMEAQREQERSGAPPADCPAELAIWPA